MSFENGQYRSRAVRALVILHEEQLRRFLATWKTAQAMRLALPATDDPAYVSLEELGRHVFGAARGYMRWICEKLQLPEPAIRPVPASLSEDEADTYLDHVLEGWRAPLLGVGDEQLDSPEFPSRWNTLYSIDAMLEHAVMHPIRHAFQLEELMNAQRR